VDYIKEQKRMAYKKNKLLLDAFENDNEAIIKYLIEHGTNVNQIESNGYSLLVNSCRKNNETIVKYLIEHGANVNACDKWNESSPLTIACRTGNENIMFN